MNEKMTTKGMYKLDDGNCHPSNCFPARSLLQPQYKEGGGHWQVARHTAEKTKIELHLTAKASQIKWRRLPTTGTAQKHMKEKILDGVQLMKLHHVRRPSHLCSVDISNQNFSLATEEDFEQFDSVAYINATENLLTLEVFRTFPGLRELDLSLNGLRNLKVNAGDFSHLEVLDLSYNNLSPEDVQALGVLSHLKVLQLTANGLQSLPLDLTVPDSESHPRFAALEVLLLDDNHLSHPNVFVSLANLRSLKQLNLEKNGIKEVPYLHCGNNSNFSIHPLSAKSGIREGLRSRKSAGKRLRRNQSSGQDNRPDYIVLPNSKDPDKTEIIFPSPDPVSQDNSPSSGIASCCDTSTGFNQEFTLPLPELRFLNLANNQIEHEEDLLAVALFPSLTELTFHGNPFTIAQSGDPPLLTSFLQNKLGIKLVRRKISKLEKPRIFIPDKANRKVKSQLPKIRKRPLMLKPPPETSFWELWTGSEVDTGIIMNLVEPEPLPPIRTLPAEEPATIAATKAEPPEEAKVIPVSAVVSSHSLEDVVKIVPAAQSSMDQILVASVPDERKTSVEQILSAAVSRATGRFSVAAQAHLGLAASAESLTTEVVLTQEEGSLPPSEIAAAEQEPAPPPNSPLPAQGPEEPAAGLPATEQAPSSISSTAEQDNLQPPQPPSIPLQEQDLPHTEPPTSSLPTEEQRLSVTGLSTGPPLDAQDQGEPMQAGPLPDAQEERLPAGPLPDAEDQQEHIQSGPLPDAQDQQEHIEAGPLPDQQEHIQTGPLPDAQVQQEHIEAGPLPNAQEQEEHVEAGPLPDQQEHKEAGPLPDAKEQEEHLPLIPEAQDALAPLPSLPSQAEGLKEPVSSTVSSTEDLPEILPDNRLPSTEADQLAPVLLPSTLLPDQDLPEPVPPTGPPVAESLLTAPEQNLSEISPPPEPPPEEQDSLRPAPLATSTFQELSQPGYAPLGSSSSVPGEASSREDTHGHLFPPASASSISPGTESSEPSSTFIASGEIPENIQLDASSRDLYLLFREARKSLLEASDEQSSGADLLSIRSSSSRSGSSKESLEIEESDSFFITQVEPSTSRLRKETRTQPSGVTIVEPQQVPEKYRGYEELLDSHTDKDPDFIEPVGIQQNVQALKKALQYPLIYRASKARVDSPQQRFKPMEKKVLRIPPAKPRKTKEQRLEEILRQMRNPTNIFELPLICIIRNRKSNWKEYREALALLKEFQQEYKATVKACGMGSEISIKSKTSSGQTPLGLAAIRDLLATCHQELESESTESTSQFSKEEDQGL